MVGVLCPRIFSASRPVLAAHLFASLSPRLLSPRLRSGIHTTVIHTWIRTAIAQVERAFKDPPTKAAEERNDKRQIDILKARIEQKNEVIAELMQENIQAKKDSGEL